MLRKQIVCAIGMCGLFGLGFSAGAVAQDAQDAPDRPQTAETLQEVIVTARKREEALQDVPLSISVFAEDDIRAADLRSLQDVATMTPGFQFVSMGLRSPGRYESQLQFRGLTTAQFSPSFATGALFIDGQYVLGGATSLSLMDIERIEVIKGPQAAYFGRNTFGGAVNMITRDPNMQEFAGELNVRTTDRSNNDFSGIIEFPLVQDVLSASLSARLYDKRGQWTATDGGRMGDEETKTVNGVLKWNATDALEFKLRYSYSEDDDGAAAQGYISGIKNDTCTGLTLDTPEGPANPTRYVCGAVPYGSAVITDPGSKAISSNTRLPPYPPLAALTDLPDAFSDVPHRDDIGLSRETERLTFMGSYAFQSGYTLDFSYGKNEQNANFLRDYDITDRITFFSSDPQTMEDESAEIRLGGPQDSRFRWLVGYNTYEQKFTTSGEGGTVTTSCFGAVQTPFQDNYPGNCVGGAPGVFNLVLPLGLANADKAKVEGIFAALDFDITDRVTLSVEGRYQEDTLTKGAGVATPGGTVLKETFSDFLPRVILRWMPADETNVWASYSEGMIAGDFNSTFINSDERERAQYVALNPAISEALDAETLEAWEIGAKQGFMGGRGQVSASVYYYEWANIKGRSSYPINETCRPADMGAVGCDPALGQAVGDPKRFLDGSGELAPLFTIRNVLLPGDATLWGAELELAYRFTDSLLWQLNGAYTASEYDDYEFNFVTPVAGYSQMAGNQTPRQPKWSGNSSLIWDLNAFGKPAYVRGDVLYQGEAFADESNLAKIDDYWLLNLRAGIELGAVTVELFSTNLTDEKAWQTGARWTDWSSPTQFPHLTEKQGVVAAPLDRREFGLRVNFRF